MVLEVCFDYKKCTQHEKEYSFLVQKSFAPPKICLLLHLRARVFTTDTISPVVLNGVPRVP